MCLLLNMCSFAAGEITIVGPPLSSLDAELAFKQDAGNRAKDARKQAQMSAAAQEARGMLGMHAICLLLLDHPSSITCLLVRLHGRSRCMQNQCINRPALNY